MPPIDGDRLEQTHLGLPPSTFLPHFHGLEASGKSSKELLPPSHTASEFPPPCPWFVLLSFSLSVPIFPSCEIQPLPDPSLIHSCRQGTGGSPQSSDLTFGLLFHFSCSNRQLFFFFFPEGGENDGQLSRA